jgi:O-acetylserine/cysteine efflux transporter
MSLREFSVLMVVCLFWGLHFVVMKLTVMETAEPLFYAAVRMSIVGVLLLPKLKWHKGQMRAVCMAGACYAGFNYAFAFPALAMTTASAAAIAFELTVPFSIILSVLFFKDRIGLPKITGIALAFAGVAIVAMARPDEAAGPLFFLGIAMIAAAALSEAFGAILIKKVNGVDPWQLLAWFAIVGSLILWPLTFLMESNQTDAFKGDNLVPFLLALTYSALAVSIIAHASYYWLLQRLPIYMVATGGMMTTVIAVTAGVVILGEPLNIQIGIGALLTLIGVGLILLRNKIKTDQKTPLASVLPNNPPQPIAEQNRRNEQTAE